MRNNNTVKLLVLNKNEIDRAFRALQFRNSSDKTALRKLVKAPILKIEQLSKTNLTGQGSHIKGNLERSFRTRSRVRGHKYIARFESSSPYAKALNKGTGKRYTKTNPRRFTGAVGRATTNYKGRNHSFRIGFADRAANSIVPSLSGHLTKGVREVVNNIIKREMKQ